MSLFHVKFFFAINDKLYMLLVTRDKDGKTGHLTYVPNDDLDAEAHTLWMKDTPYNIVPFKPRMQIFYPVFENFVEFIDKDIPGNSG